jgi:hypothetical protein
MSNETKLSLGHQFKKKLILQIYKGHNSIMVNMKLNLYFVIICTIHRRCISNVVLDIKWKPFVLDG